MNWPKVWKEIKFGFSNPGMIIFLSLLSYMAIIIAWMEGWLAPSDGIVARPAGKSRPGRSAP